METCFQIRLLLSSQVESLPPKAVLSVFYDFLDPFIFIQVTPSDVYDAIMVKGRTALRLSMVLVLGLADLKLAEEPSGSPLLPNVVAPFGQSTDLWKPVKGARRDCICRQLAWQDVKP